MKRKPPEKNFVNWDKNTFLRLISAPPERLTSRFQVTHGMLLNVLSRKGDGCRGDAAADPRLPRNAQGEEGAHRSAPGNCSARWWSARSWSSFPRPSDGVYLRVNVELQDDFSMDQTLSLYLLDTIPLMDPQAPDYALVLLTLVESILEDPDIILRKQLDKVKDQKMAEMKMEGIEYDQRMEELEKLEYPKPNREFIYSTFNAFADSIRGWARRTSARNPSRARCSRSSARSPITSSDYELQRAEGVLLRHLNSVFKVLAQTVPDAAKNDQVREMELYLGTMIRQVDSSLLDEWEKMRDPNYQPGRKQGSAPARRGGSRGRHHARHQGFHRRDPQPHFHFPARTGDRRFRTSPRAISIHRWTPTASRGRRRDCSSRWTPTTPSTSICLDPNARNVRHTYVTARRGQKNLARAADARGPGGDNDWVAEFEVDLAESRKSGEPFLRLRRIGSLT